MENNEIQTKEADIQNNDIKLEQEIEELSRVEQSSNTAVPPDNSSKQENDSIFLEEVVKSYYDPNVLLTNSPELEVVDYYFKSVTDEHEDIENLLYEMIGYSLAKTTKLSKGFILYGKGRNGKSKVFRVLEKLLGDQCSHEHLEALSGCKAGSKTTIKQLDGVTLNIAEDQKQPRYINNSFITRLISGEPISIEQKGDDNFELKPYATLLFSVNEVINFKEVGKHITDRFIVIPFTVTFTDENNNRDIEIGEKLCQNKALKIIATRSIQAFNKVLEKGSFTIPQSVKDETDRYFNECSNVCEFCSTLPVETFIFKSRYYEEYCKWCANNNLEAVSNAQFGKTVLSLGYRAERYSFANKRNTYYTAPDFNNDDSRIIYDEFLAYTGITEETDRVNNNEPRQYVNGTFSDYLCKYLYYELGDVNSEYAQNFMNLYNSSTDNISNS